MKTINLLLGSFLFISLAVSCKSRPDIPWLSKKKGGASQQTVPNTVGSNSGNQTSVPMPDKTAEDLFATILAGMKAKHADSENKTWFETKAEITGDWIAHSPKNYWGLELSQLPSGFDCEKGTIGCDLVFERKLCATDADCAASRTRCMPFEASVAKPGDKAKLMCLGSGDKVIDDYYSTIVKTEKHLEISSLTMPSGRFRKALANAFAYLTHKNPTTSIRILLSSVDGISPNIFNPPAKIMGQVLKEVDAAGGDSKKIRMDFGYISYLDSWNHTKIVLADAKHLLQGGHNFLDPDYVRETPIFDLSMHASGNVGVGVQNFINTMWAKNTARATNYGKGPKIEPPSVPDAKTGSSLVMGMGRMGRLGNNAADDGIRLLLSSAKKSVYFAQQDIFNDIAKVGPKPSHALPELVDAILRGVHIKVAQSSSTKFLGYGMVAPEKAAKLLRDAVVSEAEKRKFVPPNNQALSEYLCDHIEYAPFLFSTKIKEWSKSEALGVHPKLIIVDETGFYMGSQNFYPSDLQEFGLFVSDTKVTGQLLDQYWNKIWANSSLNKVACR